MRLRNAFLMVAAVYAVCIPAALYTRSLGPVSVPTLVERLMPSVVKVETDAWSGSGVFVRNDTILTARHVAADANGLRIITNDGTRYEVIGVTLCEDGNDLALLRVRTPDREPRLPVKMGVVAEVAIHIGAPLGIYPTVATGTVSRLHADVPELNGKNMLQTDTFMCPGSSGGPIFDTQGRLLGIVSGGPMPGIGYCVGAEAIQKFLREWDL